MKRRTRTTCLAFNSWPLALLTRGQNVATLSPALTVEQAAEQRSSLPEFTLEQAVELAVAMIAGLYDRAQRRAYRTTILSVFVAISSMGTARAAQDQDPRGKDLPMAPSALMRSELGAFGGTNTRTSTVAASVNGTVLDDSGAILPGAKAEIETTAHDGSRTATAGEDAAFQFDGLKPNVAYVVTVSADGTSTWKSEPIILQPGQSLTLNDIHLRVEVVDSITVFASQGQIAAAQVQLETQQRMFGFVPNFYTVYDGANAVPLTPKLKFQLALRTSIDPVTITGVGFMAGIKQAAKTPNYQMGAAGYGQRFGVTAATKLSDILIGAAVLPSLFHQDPRYFYQGGGSTHSRLMHALSYAFITRGDNGHRQFNISSIGGNLAESAVETACYPQANRDAARFGAEVALATAERTLSAIAQEFILPRFSSKAKFHADSNGARVTDSQAQH